MNDLPKQEAGKWDEWRLLSENGHLDRRKPSEIVAAFRAMAGPDTERTRGRLLEHLQDRARRYLRQRVRRDLLDGGSEIIEEVIGKLNEALLDPTSKDGVGFERSFHKKLRERLTDRLRPSLREKEWVEQFPTDDDETGFTFDPPDSTRLSPEQLTIAADILERLDPLHRKAFALYLNGFTYTSSNPDESIAVLLGKSPQTIKTWIDRIKADIFELLGATK